MTAMPAMKKPLLSSKKKLRSLKRIPFKPLRVGFDLDGVVLYNPARIVRRPVTFFKLLFFPKRKRGFLIPTKPAEKLLLRVFHWSSFMVAPGFEMIKKLKDEGLIEPYIITARFSFLRGDFEKWVKKLDIPVHFKGHFMNDKDEQPHEFKERMVKELKLDMFVEDNLDIVEHLNKTTKARVLWVYNLFDTWVHYPHKFPTLQKAVEDISTYARTKR